MKECKEVCSFNNTFFDQSIQIIPVGFSAGKTIFGFGEVNIGGPSGTFVGGMGYRF